MKKLEDYQLVVYEVIDKEICVLVIAIEEKDKNEVYRQARQRSKKL